MFPRQINLETISRTESVSTHSTWTGESINMSSFNVSLHVCFNCCSLLTHLTWPQSFHYVHQWLDFLIQIFTSILERNYGFFFNDDCFILWICFEIFLQNNFSIYILCFICCLVDVNSGIISIISNTFLFSIASPESPLIFKSSAMVRKSLRFSWYILTFPL